MNFRLMAGLVAVASGFPITIQAQKITTFDPPGSTNTQVTAINDGGEIVGYYADSSGATHGFLRTVDGRFTSFDVPKGINTTPLSNNRKGAVTGYYNDNKGGIHGYVRPANGTFTTFNVKNALETVPISINARGEVAGFFEGSAAFGFEGDIDGTITQIDVPGAISTEA